MGIIECLSDWFQNSDGIAKTKRTILFENRVQWSAGDVLHCNIVDALILTNVVNSDNMRMTQISRSACLAFKSLDKFSVETQLRGQHFQRNDPLKLCITCPIHTGHTTATKLLDHLITTDAPSASTTHPSLQSHIIAVVSHNICHKRKCHGIISKVKVIVPYCTHAFKA